MRCKFYSAPLRDILCRNLTWISCQIKMQDPTESSDTGGMAASHLADQGMKISLSISAAHVNLYCLRLNMDI